MAERRLRTILLHLSPPLTSSSSFSTEIPGASPSSFRSSGGSHKCILDGSPQPSHRTMSSSCDYSHLCRSMERSNSDEDPNQIGGEKSAGGEELESGNNKDLDTHGKSLRFTYRGPFGNTEAALLVFSLRSKMQGLVIGQRTSKVNDQLVVEICRGGKIAVDNVRECKDDREYGGVIIDDVGVSTKDKWVVIEVKDVELNTGTRKASAEEKKEREDNQSCRSSEGNSESSQQRADQFHQENERNNQREIEKEIGVNDAVATGYRGLQRVRGLVRADTTSSDAVSKKGNLQGRSLSGGLDLSVQKIKSRSGGQGKGVREATCVFCDIIHGAAPCLKLYEDEACLCILDVNPLSFGGHVKLLDCRMSLRQTGLSSFSSLQSALFSSKHQLVSLERHQRNVTEIKNGLLGRHSLILPKAHFRSLEATPPQVAAAMCAAVPLISSALLEATHCDSFNMLVNSGVAAGQVIFHTHFHIIPRCAGDGLWQSESTFRKVSNQRHEAKLLAHMVRTKLSSSTGQ